MATKHKTHEDPLSLLRNCVSLCWLLSRSGQSWPWPDLWAWACSQQHSNVDIFNHTFTLSLSSCSPALYYTKANHTRRCCSYGIYEQTHNFTQYTLSFRRVCIHILEDKLSHCWVNFHVEFTFQWRKIIFPMTGFQESVSSLFHTPVDRSCWIPAEGCRRV